MATKNIARSAVEGGRAGRFTEKVKTRSQRRKVRAMLHGQDATGQDAVDKFERRSAPIREKAWDGGFRDKLAPLHRWLQKNAGRPWNKVYSELCARFDRRSLKGWHLLSAHVDVYTVIGHGPALPGWRVNQPAYTSGPYVDRHGILRYRQYRRWPPREKQAGRV
jgi:hypothetical protein